MNENMSYFLALIQLQWKVRSRTTCCSWGHNYPRFHHCILKSLEIFELFIRHTFPPSIFLFVFVVLGSDVFAVYSPQSDWCRVYILSLEHSSGAHAQSSFNICSNPCSSCRLNGSYVWYFSSLLFLMRRFRCAPMSHTHLSFQCKKLSFCNAQTGNEIQAELKEGGCLSMYNTWHAEWNISLFKHMSTLSDDGKYCFCAKESQNAFITLAIILTGRLDRISFSLFKVENSNDEANPLSWMLISLRKGCWWCQLSVNSVQGINGLCSPEFLCSSFLHDEAYVKTKNTRLSDVTTEGTTHNTNDFQEVMENQSTVQWHTRSLKPVMHSCIVLFA